MKWANKGHELDELGAKYMQVKNLYIWGAGHQGKRMLNLLRWLKLDGELSINFVDSDAKKQGTHCENVPIISPEQFFHAYNAETAVLTVCFENIYYELVKQYGTTLPTEVFINYAQRVPDKDFVRKFVCVYLMYKRGKLLSAHTNYIITTVCNLNCKGCLNFNNYIQKPADETFENFKKHIDTVFTKFDYLASFHFSGGEVLLHKELPVFLKYLFETYGDRIYEIYFVTNGTVVPTEELLKIMLQTKCWVLLDDYRHNVARTVETFPKIKKLLDDNGIKYEIAKADFWYDLGITDKEIGTDLSEEELISRCADCGVHYFQDFFDGKIFGCCYIGYTNDMYGNKAGIYSPETNDYIEISNASKMEILEYRFGYTEKGFFNLCRRCSEIFGRTSVKIPVAEQLSTRNGKK